MKINRIHHILKSFELNKYYYANDWVVDGKINIKEVFYLQPVLIDDKKFNYHINSTDPSETYELIRKSFDANGYTYKLYSLNRDCIEVRNDFVKINLHLLNNLLAYAGYEDHNIKQKEIYLNENFHLKPDDYNDD